MNPLDKFASVVDYSGREKMRSKSLKAFAGKALTPVKKQHKQGGTMLSKLSKKHENTTEG